MGKAGPAPVVLEPLAEPRFIYELDHRSVTTLLASLQFVLEAGTAGRYQADIERTYRDLWTQRRDYLAAANMAEGQEITVESEQEEGGEDETP